MRFFYHVGYKTKYIYCILAKLRRQVKCTEIQMKCTCLYVHFTTTHLMLSYYFRSNVTASISFFYQFLQLLPLFLCLRENTSQNSETMWWLLMENSSLEILYIVINTLWTLSHSKSCFMILCFFFHQTDKATVWKHTFLTVIKCSWLKKQTNKKSSI